MNHLSNIEDDSDPVPQPAVGIPVNNDDTSPYRSADEKHPANVHCAWCKAPIGYDPAIDRPEYKGLGSHGMCQNCKKDFMQELTEDWTFEPTKDTNMANRDIRFTMSNIADIKPKNSALPNYKQSTDKSMEKSEKMRKLYRAMNNAYSRPGARLPLGY